MKMDYTKCCLYEKDICGPYKRLKPPAEGLVTVEDLGCDILPHLMTLKLKKLNDNNNDGWDERKLIENRLDKVLKEQDTICSHHRFMYGIGWKPLKRCQHPHHVQNQKKSPVTRPIPIKTVLQISKRYNCFLPIGSAMCYNHLKDEQKLMKSEQCSVLEDTIAESFPVEDPDYEPEEIVVAEDVLDSSMNTSQVLANCLEDSPVRFQLKRKRVEDLSKNTKIYLRCK